jgi:hypothetical protein
MPKLNVTHGHLLRTKPDGIRRTVPISKADLGQTIGRLSWKVPPGDAPEYCTEDELAENFDASSELQIVIDSSFLPRHNVSLRLWQSMIRHRVLVLPAVDWELCQFKSDSNSSIFADLKAAKNGAESTIEFISPLKDPADPIAQGLQYYIGLLGFRKKAKAIVLQKLRKQGVTNPSEAEISNELNSFVELTRS